MYICTITNKGHMESLIDTVNLFKSIILYVKRKIPKSKKITHVYSQFYIYVNLNVSELTKIVVLFFFLRRKIVFDLQKRKCGAK